MANSLRYSVKQLLNEINTVSCRCPAHSHGAFLDLKYNSNSIIKKEYAYEMSTANIRYGEGVTQEVGMDLVNLGAKNVLVMTDKNISKLPIMKTVLESFHKNKLNFQVYDNVRIEPTDKSFKEAITYAKSNSFDAYVAVGGGSVMDTCKATNLYDSNRNSEFLDFVNSPIGKGLPVENNLKPLIAVPTTAGTGSETTGVAVFDFEDLKAKTGIANRKLRPILGLVDPLHIMTMPERVTCYSGFDVLCHALESYTALPYYERIPRPVDPKLRPAYQGSNPISDIWSKHALHVVAKYFKRAVRNSQDKKARSEMLLASVFAGIGFGNAGVHLCHGLSYAIAGNVKTYQPKDYKVNYPIIPHGLSVVLTAPAVFQFTASACPERHLEAAGILGADIRNAKLADAGNILADQVRSYMYDLNIDDGLKAVGYNMEDISKLVEGTLPQDRVTKLSPRQQSREDLAGLFEKSLTVY